MQPLLKLKTQPSVSSCQLKFVHVSTLSKLAKNVLNTMECARLLGADVEVPVFKANKLFSYLNVPDLLTIVASPL